METIKDLEGLFLHFIENLYATEKQIAEAMPAIIQKVRHKSLKNALQHHLTISNKHSNRLNKILSLMHEDTAGATRETKKETVVISKGAIGLIEEANDLMSQHIDKYVNDAAIIGCVQKIEHYEICTYGTALAYATQLHLHKVAELLRETLYEEYDADDLLTALATAALNKEGIPDGWEEDAPNLQENNEAGTGTETSSHKIVISERTVNSPGGRAGTSHRRYPSGESRGH